MIRPADRLRRLLVPVLGLGLLAWAVAYLGTAVDLAVLARVGGQVAAAPLGLLAALAAYSAAFALRSWAWTRVLPGLGFGPAWAAIHVSLLGNHVLPARLGEGLRPLSVARRTAVGLRAATASTLTLRALDLLSVLGLAAVGFPAALQAVAGVPVLAGAALGLAGLLMAGAPGGRRRGREVGRPGPGVVGAVVLAWALEAAVVWQVASVAGVGLSAWEAVGVTAVTIAAQAVALTPGGLGTYEATATAALATLGVPAPVGFAVALTTHAVKTAYSLVAGGVALVLPRPSLLGRWRLPRALPARPAALAVEPDAPVVVMIPVYDEAGTVGEVVRRVPRSVAGHRVEVLVVDDGSTDGSAAAAASAGARVVAQPHNLGLGAAVRRGLAEACGYSPAAVVYLDADAEYFPEDINRVVAPVLSGQADYVVGSRFAGEILHMMKHRRFGNTVLTRWVRWMTRRADLTDGQSGFRAFSLAAAADAEVCHDYNYAQVLTLDLLGKGYRYAEVPITYAFRQSGQSFVRLGRYLRKVVPAVWRELQSPPVAQSSTTWSANLARAAAQEASSRLPS